MLRFNTHATPTTQVLDWEFSGADTSLGSLQINLADELDGPLSALSIVVSIPNVCAPLSLRTFLRALRYWTTTLESAPPIPSRCKFAPAFSTCKFNPVTDGGWTATPHLY